MNIPVLDHGYVRFVEDYGHGDAQVAEAGIIEAARMSTQKAFLGWGPVACPSCVDNGDPAERCEDQKLGDEKLLKYLYENHHSTPFEFAGLIIEVQAPIFVFREWHRHRTQAYGEMSARYAPVPDNHYLPTVDRCMMNVVGNKQAGKLAGADELTHEMALDWLEDQAKLYELQEAHYQKGLRIGIPKEIARVGMPVGRYSRMRAHANLRNWLLFMTLRSDRNAGAQWEIRQFANAVGTILAARFPRTWELWFKGGY